ncbi:MarR family winged helix-turn-helix transcriptional regulator [Nocardioides marmoribigeumensis]|jgi:DNA-binding MarR family transcriptional regulator|uniref:DNA-binding MarR family transcriptional regulator n=1 Tax=Nocardioides marmoribigeumensis TaxID=433649 RepID=A0ABU2BPW3_9ACTN|nr:MarR family transcriptional regulator [Nocardioides marmoribigeumensis]MDR7360682.1 DNA-binding MarR family transcriptional regulator [Nocardioides marmoribigeumensis]
MVSDDALVDAFVTASRALVAVAVHSVSSAPVDLTVVQFRVLVLVAEGGLSIGDLAEHLGVNQSNASRQVDRLERHGLVSRQRLDSDARVVVVGLTAEGQDVVETVMQRRRDDVRRLLGPVPPARAAALVEALEAFNQAARDLDEAPWARDPW